MEISPTTIVENHIIYIHNVLFRSNRFVDNKYNEIYSKHMSISYDSCCIVHILASVHHANPFIDDVIKFYYISIFITYLQIVSNIIFSETNEQENIVLITDDIISGDCLMTGYYICIILKVFMFRSRLC